VAALALAAPAQAQQEPTAPATAEESAAGAELTIRASRDVIDLGEGVAFSGTRRPARHGQVVQLQYRPAGESFRTVAETRTRADGSYAVSARPRRNGTFRAVSARASGPLVSRRVDVDVHAALALAAERHQLRDRGLRVRGDLRPPDAGRRIAIQRVTPKGWETVAATRTTEGGAFRTRFEPPALGAYALRARVAATEANLGDRVRLDHKVYVYREDHASYYGPGFYGNRTACGQILREETVGVAHKRLRCGTNVRFHYRGRTRVIEVIDRGPYIEGRRWDLTDAARERLGFPRGVDAIWATK
jgi:hypothetical protein